MNTKPPKTLKAVCPLCGRGVTVFQPAGSLFRWLVAHMIPKRQKRCRGSLMHIDSAPARKAVSR